MIDRGKCISNWKGDCIDIVMKFKLQFRCLLFLLILSLLSHLFFFIPFVSLPSLFFLPYFIFLLLFFSSSCFASLLICFYGLSLSFRLLSSYTQSSFFFSRSFFSFLSFSYLVHYLFHLGFHLNFSHSPCLSVVSYTYPSHSFSFYSPTSQQYYWI